MPLRFEQWSCVSVGISNRASACVPIPRRRCVCRFEAHLVYRSRVNWGETRQEIRENRRERERELRSSNPACTLPLRPFQEQWYYGYFSTAVCHHRTDLRYYCGCNSLRGTALKCIVLRYDWSCRVIRGTAMSHLSPINIQFHVSVIYKTF